MRGAFRVFGQRFGACVVKMTALAGAGAADPSAELSWVKSRLQFLEEKRMWPVGNKVRYLWTDAWGIVVLASLYHATGEERWLQTAEWIVRDVQAKLGDTTLLRIGEQPPEKRQASYAHYLAVWLYALACLGRFKRQYLDLAVATAQHHHQYFVVPGRGVWWMVYADGRGPVEGYGFGGLDAFDLYAVYKVIDEACASGGGGGGGGGGGQQQLVRERQQLAGIINREYKAFKCDQDLGLGSMLWVTHLVAAEHWAQAVRAVCIDALDGLWVDKGSAGGHFARSSRDRETCIAFANYGASVGLQVAGVMPDRVRRLNAYLEHYTHDDDPELDADPITHVMACASHFPGLFHKRVFDAAGAGAGEAATSGSAAPKAVPGLFGDGSPVVAAADEGASGSGSGSLGTAMLPVAGSGAGTPNLT